ncbi:MAG TPA: hypothetical protein P5572_12500 [Phycisphaerae bacterium]|nr:hypothetical protein [Phycisphaerae bacterium]
MTARLPIALGAAAMLFASAEVRAIDLPYSPRNVTTNGLHFHYAHATYRELLDDFEWTTGWKIDGPRPEGSTTLDCGRESMSFDLAITRLNMVCYHACDDAFFVRRRLEPTIKIIRLADRCGLTWGLKWMFTSVESITKTTYPADRPALLLYGHDATPIPEILKYANLVPSYVVMMEYDCTGKNLTMLASLTDLRLYVPLLDMLDVALQDDATVVAEIKLERGEPDDLAQTLASLYPDTIIYHPLGDERQTEPPGADPALRVWTDWAHRRVVVTGSAEAVAEAQALARLLDTPSPAPSAASTSQPDGRDLQADDEVQRDAPARVP